jgi:hypothetical protein
MPVFVTWSQNPKAPDPLSILAHQLRRRFPSNNSLVRGAGLLYSSAPPEGSLLVRSIQPGTRTEVPGQNRPMFHGPSWGDRSCVPLCFQYLRRATRNRVALEAISSSGASSRLAPKRTRKLSPLPAGRDRTFGHLPHPSCRFRPSGEAGTAVPITQEPCTFRPSRGSKKFGNKPVDNGDIGNNRRNLSSRPICGGTRLPFRSPPPTSAKCLNRLHSLRNPRICRA